jgi:hypothetical protein
MVARSLAVEQELRAIGDVIIMKNGVINTKLGNVADPRGIKQLINTLKREVAAAHEQTPLKPRPISMKTKSSVTSGIFCKSCGTELPAGSNFCNKCDAVQN